MVVPRVLAPIAAVIQRERARMEKVNVPAKSIASDYPRRRVDIELARMLQADGRELREIARLMNVGRGTLVRALQVADASNGKNQYDKSNNCNAPTNSPDGTAPAGSEC